MKKKNIWFLILFLLCGIIIGNLIGEVTKDIEFLWFLNYGDEFGLESPVVLDLSVLVITFGFRFRLTICAIIGIIISCIIYKKL